MGNHEYEIGLHKSELDTPALLVDMDAVESNIAIMASYANTMGVRLRPHAKVFKATPYFAWLLLRAGAIGLTVSKLAEAETLAAGGIRDILIANQVVGERKIRRLVNLAGYTDIIVALDCYENLQNIADMAKNRGVSVGVLVEVDIGNNRCGITPYEETRKMAETVLAAQGLKFRGIMGYDGHLAFEKDKDEKRRKSVAAYELLVDVSRDLERAGIRVEIVSGGGSATYQYAASVKGMTELQVGTYIFNDTTYLENGLEQYNCALSVLGTVVSRPQRPGSDGMAIIDVGRKSISCCYGFPQVKSFDGELFSMPQEHSRIRPLAGECPGIGEKVELFVRDANDTVNLYDHMYAMRGDIVEAVWDIYCRGKAT